MLPWASDTDYLDLGDLRVGLALMGEATKAVLRHGISLRQSHTMIEPLSPSSEE
jgi:hypothetical protein